MVIRVITFWLAVSRDSGKHFTLPIYFLKSQTRANRRILIAPGCFSLLVSHFMSFSLHKEKWLVRMLNLILCSQGKHKHS